MTEPEPVAEPKFIADENVGKLARWLRVMGYDTLFFENGDDSVMVARALAEDRIILTRDTAIMDRRLITEGRLKAVLLRSPQPEEQLRQVVEALSLDYHHRPFTLCPECNQRLIERTPEEVKDRVPPYVFRTQKQYMECPACHRIYWKGTHWESMTRRLKNLRDGAVKKI